MGTLKETIDWNNKLDADIKALQDSKHKPVWSAEGGEDVSIWVDGDIKGGGFVLDIDDSVTKNITLNELKALYAILTEMFETDLQREAPAMFEAIDEFCDRRDKGEIKSIKTYAKFKEILDRIK